MLKCILITIARYGVDYRKRTTFYVSDAVMLSSLQKRCNHRKKHERLAGWKDRCQASKMPKSKHKATKLCNYETLSCVGLTGEAASAAAVAVESAVLLEL